MKKILFLGLLSISGVCGAAQKKVLMSPIQELWQACEDGNADRVASLLACNQGLDVNAVNEDGRSPLMLSAYHNNATLTELLLKAGAHSNQKSIAGLNNEKCTPLYLACGFGYEKNVRALLSDENIDVNSGCSENTPLVAACDKGNSSIVAMLLKHKDIKINPIGSAHSPLLLACQHGYGCIVRMLLDCPEIQVNAGDKEEWTPLFAACWHDRGNARRPSLLDVLATPENREGRKGYDGTCNDGSGDGGGS